MRVKCVLCDNIENIHDDSPLAKRLRNRPIHTYMCINCHDRISTKTEEHFASGNFRLYQHEQADDDW